MKKSSEHDLRNRGMALPADITALEGLSVEELFNKLGSPVSAERSAAVIVLRDKCSIDNEEYINKLLLLLTKEKSLYTKIEICSSLEKGNSETALKMIPYLGKIGNNRHLVVADFVSLKKSFPLQRDIIARTISRMDKSVFPVLLNQLKTIHRNQLSELLDAIGYMAFYNRDLATSENFSFIAHIAELYHNDELIIWKIALCCSGFPLPESKTLLNSIKENTHHEIIRSEIDRSLNLINSNMNS